MSNTWNINILPAGASENTAFPLAKLNGTTLTGALEVRLSLKKSAGDAYGDATLGANLGAFLFQGPSFNEAATTGPEQAVQTPRTAASAPSAGFDGACYLEIVVASASQAAIVLAQSGLNKVPGAPQVGHATATQLPIEYYRAKAGDTVNVIHPTSGATLYSFTVPGGGFAATYVTFDDGRVSP